MSLRHLALCPQASSIFTRPRVRATRVAAPSFRIPSRSDRVSQQQRGNSVQLEGRKERAQLQVTAATKQQFSSFDDMIANSEVPLLIGWYATWCGPCQMQASELEMFAAQMGNAVKVVKIDTEKYPNLSSRYAVQGLPTLMLVRDGKVLNRWEGLVQAARLVEQARYYLGASR